MRKNADIWRAGRVLSRKSAGFFDEQGYLEVHTPALQVCPTIDAHIHAFKTELKGADLSHKKTLYLHTSPEFDMKRLMVSGCGKIYQLNQVFRNSDGSNLHSPEFMLLEWYTAGNSYHQAMDISMDILRNVVDSLCIKTYNFNGTSSDPHKDVQKISVSEAFLEYTDIDLENYINDIKGFSKVVSALGVRVSEQDRWDDLFHAVMAEKIEPNLGVEQPTLLYDYPVSMASLSQKKPENPNFAERFELYVCGVELANGFSELTDAAEQRRRYEADMALKQELYGETYPPDEEFFKALEHGLPDCAGVALGVDRLVMLATGAEHINDVLWAPVQTD